MFKYLIFSLLILIIPACSINNGSLSGSSSTGSYGNSGSAGGSGVVHSPGDKFIYSADGVSFTVIFTPAKNFLTGSDDMGSGSVSASFWIAETETTYELWNKIYIWAITNGYTLNDAGVKGDGGAGETVLHPVTTINWRDAMVWTNALTEWYNAKSGATLYPVYKSSGTPLRDSTNTALCDAAVQDTSASGFRLLVNSEWELAARYISDANNDGDISDTGEFYNGNHVSGDTTSYCYPSNGGVSTVFGDYAWYSGNSGSSTHEVKSKTVNNLGLFDMSGNVYEWIFDQIITDRGIKGGSWFHDADRLEIGALGGFSPDLIHSSIGFRIGLNN